MNMKSLFKKRIDLDDGYYAERDCSVKGEALYNVFDEQDNVLMLHVTEASFKSGEERSLLADFFLPNIQYAVNEFIADLECRFGAEDLFEDTNFCLLPDGSIRYVMRSLGDTNGPTETVVMPSVFNGRYERNVPLNELLDDYGNQLDEAYRSIVHEAMEAEREAADYYSTVMGVAC